MVKNQTITVRLTEDEMSSLNDLTEGPLTRSQIIRILLQDFLEKTKDEQRKFLVKKLFGPPKRIRDDEKWHKTH
jgi:metal-responsive CopG/Arc/MetJ family transcriptional regulator